MEWLPGRGSHQVTSEPNRTRQRAVTQLEWVRSVAATDTPVGLCLDVPRGDMSHRAMALARMVALVSSGRPYPISCGHRDRVS